MPGIAKTPTTLADSRVVVMMTRQERAQLDEKAAALGMNVSQFIRWRIRGGESDLAELLARLERLEAYVAARRQAVSA